MARIAHHALRVSDPERSLAFYVGKLGMHLVRRYSDSSAIEHLHLDFSPGLESPHAPRAVRPQAALLHLCHNPRSPARSRSADPNAVDGYWKIGITLNDVDRARAALVGAGVAVGEPQQFLDVGYLCHLNDPDGYSIELLQHTFAEEKTSQPADPGYRLQCKPCFAHITLRISDPDKSLAFYMNALGLRLLSRQVIKPHRFTLYFLGFGDETPPNPDLEAVENRPWLWQQPYTVLELQHRWAGKNALRTGCETGYEHVGMLVPRTTFNKRLDSVENELRIANGEIRQTGRRTRIVRDPDGYALQLNEQEV